MERANNQFSQITLKVSLKLLHINERNLQNKLE